MPSIFFREVHNYDHADAIELTVRLTHGDDSVEALASVDTGASYCVFQPAFAELLGIDIQAGEPITMNSAAGGNFRAYGHEVHLECLGFQFSATVYFADVPEFRRNVLGRTGWLNQFKLGILHHDSKLYLSHFNSVE